MHVNVLDKRPFKGPNTETVAVCGIYDEIAIYQDRFDVHDADFAAIRKVSISHKPSARCLTRGLKAHGLTWPTGCWLQGKA